jgi:hypothetical protein
MTCREPTTNTQGAEPQQQPPGTLDTMRRKPTTAQPRTAALAARTARRRSSRAATAIEQAVAIAIAHEGLGTWQQTRVWNQASAVDVTRLYKRSCSCKGRYSVAITLRATSVARISSSTFRSTARV